jgi:lipoyl(octanoyl) transferase
MIHYWRFLDTGANDAFYNMALDEALLIHSSKTRYPILRLYGWSLPSVSLGYFQKAERSLDLEFCQREGINIVRRITGGRAVYHENELTYCIIIPNKSKFFKKNNLELFRDMSKGLLLGLQKLGIDGKLEKPEKVKSRYQDKANCFNATSAYEITVGGKKIVGSAQKWSNIGVIQQGSILLNFDYVKSSMIFNQQNKGKSTDSGFVTISEALGFVPKRDICINAIKGGFEDSLGIKFIDSELRDFEVDEAKVFLKAKYSNAEWNLLNK